MRASPSLPFGSLNRRTRQFPPTTYTASPGSARSANAVNLRSEKDQKCKVQHQKMFDMQPFLSSQQCNNRKKRDVDSGGISDATTLSSMAIVTKNDQGEQCHTFHTSQACERLPGLAQTKHPNMSLCPCTIAQVFISSFHFNGTFELAQVKRGRKMWRTHLLCYASPFESTG